MSYTYINKSVKNIYATFDYELGENNKVGNSWDDYVAGMWVLLSEEQLSFKDENPDASVEEVYNMELTEQTDEQKLSLARSEKLTEINNIAKEFRHFYIDGNDVYDCNVLNVKNLCSISDTIELNGVSYESEILSEAMDELSVFANEMDSVYSSLVREVQESGTPEEVSAIVVEGFPNAVNETTDELQKTVEEKKHKDSMYQCQLLMARLINDTNVITLSSSEALEFQYVYPYWGETGAEFGKEVESGFRFNYKSDDNDEPLLFEVIQAHTLSAEWVPNQGTESLYKVLSVGESEHAGTLDDPIPWAYNMELVEGLYYIDDIVYLCIRSSGIPLAYEHLADLVSAGYVVQT